MRMFLLFVFASLLFSCSDVLLSSEYIGPTPQSSSSSVYWNTGISYGTLTDSRDGKTYRTVEMPDGNVWMAENLNYNASGSWCYSNSTSYCDTYGRLYDWSTAMAISSSYNTSYYYYNGSDEDHQGVCPIGWHLPSDSEWSALASSVGGSSTAGIKLKATSGWNYYSADVSGTDDYGFSALPGGFRYNDGSFNSVGYYGFWWSATEYYASYAYYRYLRYSLADLYTDNDFKEYGRSVRCLRD